ncbi:MAG: histidine phosphatase family protein [Rubrivivax sp.]
MPESPTRRAGLARLGVSAAAVGWGGLTGLGALMAPAHAQVASGPDATIESLLRTGGVVIAFRHALAPGTFDPPEFRLGDCSTQRNLSDDGRAQARRIGQWFSQRGLKPLRVRSSPWCRCMDTASLAFGAGPAAAWPALGSPRGASETTNAESLRELRSTLQQAGARPGFEVWVTHMFVLSDLTGQGSQSGEGLVLKAQRGGRIEVLARLLVA